MVLPHAVLCCISLKSYIILSIYLWLNPYCMLIQNLICLSSWVQLQLQNHPAELWEDGLKDYLTHASDIMVSFVDSKWTCLIFSLCHLYKSCNRYFFGNMHNHVLSLLLIDYEIYKINFILLLIADLLLKPCLFLSPLLISIGFAIILYFFHICFNIA